MRTSALGRDGLPLSIPFLPGIWERFAWGVGLPSGASRKEPTCQCRGHKTRGFNPWARKISWRRAWQPTPVFFSGESLGQRSLAGYIVHGVAELDPTERLSTACHCLGLEGVQCS